MKSLNRQQQVFCEYYIQLNNAAEAARQAGYSHASRRAYVLMKQPHIKEYIANIVKENDDKIIMKTDEILKILSRIARGEEKEEVLMSVNVGKYQQEVQKWERKAIPKDRLKALELLGKYLNMWDNRDKNELNLDQHNITITFEENKALEYKFKD
jgi:phage terminase small subunit